MRQCLILLFVMFTFFQCKKPVQVISVGDLTEKDLYGAWVSNDETAVTDIMLCIESNDWYNDAPGKNTFIIFNIDSTDTTMVFKGEFRIENGTLISLKEGTEYTNKIFDYSIDEISIFSSTSPGNKRKWLRTTSVLLPPVINYKNFYFYGNNENGACYWNDMKLYQLQSSSDSTQVQYMDFKKSKPVFAGVKRLSNNEAIALYWDEDGIMTELSNPEGNYLTPNFQNPVLKGMAVISNDVYIAAQIYINTGSDTYIKTGYWKNGVWKEFRKTGIQKEGKLYSVPTLTGICSDGISIYISGFYLPPNVNGSVGCYWKDSVRILLPDPLQATGTYTSGISIINNSLYITGSYVESYTGSSFNHLPCYWKDSIPVILEGFDNGSAEKITIVKDSVIIAGSSFENMNSNTGPKLILWKNGIPVIGVKTFENIKVHSLVYNEGMYFLSGTGTNQSVDYPYFWRIREDLKASNIRRSPFINDTASGSVWGLTVR